MGVTALDLLERLCKKYKVKILLAIYDLGETDLSNLAKIVGLYKYTVSRKIVELEGLGLIESVYVAEEKKRIVKRRIRLTEKGIKIAEKLKDILKILEI